MIAAVQVSESRLDLAQFMPTAQQVTGENHVRPVDLKPGMSQLQDDMSVLKEFSGTERGIASAVTYVGFLVAGHPHDIQEFIEYTRGMPHMYTQRPTNAGVQCVYITGSLDQWQKATIEGCRSHKLSNVRLVFNSIYRHFFSKGLGHLFDGYRSVEEGTVFLLERKK